MVRRSRVLPNILKLWIPAAVIALALAALPARAQMVAAPNPVSADVSPQLFSTFCALLASGFPPTDRVVNDPEFAALRTQLLALHGPATEAVRKFYRDHTLADASALMSRYVTFALTAGPPPDFAIRVNRDDMPPDVVSLDGFSPLLAAFYREAQIAQLWQKFQPVYEREANSLRDPLSQIVFSEIGYLRELVLPGKRTFTVYAEPMAGGSTNFRNIGDHYYIVVNPETDSFDQVRHAFLHFLLDPLPIQYASMLNREEVLFQTARDAPALPYVFRDDYSSYFDECLVRAVELRLRRLPPAQTAAELDRDEREGYVLERPIWDALPKFEKAEPSMTLYFPDFLASLDVAGETARLRTIAFVPASAAETSDEHAQRRTTATEVDPAIDADLADGDRAIATEDGPRAEVAFERILNKVPGLPRALYGLAVASLLEGNGERAQTLFQQVVASASNSGAGSMRADASELAWSHVYLARLDDVAGDRDRALAEYRAGLDVPHAPDAARAAAQQGIAQPYQPASHDAPPEQSQPADQK